MGRARFFPLVLGMLIATAPIAAQAAVRPPPTVPPFEPVRVQLPPRPNDPSLAAFRQTLAELARRRVFDELARFVRPQGFFWDGDSAKRFDPKRTGAENLATALRLGGESAVGWQMLADFAAEPTASALGSAPGALCAPGRPNFNQEDFDNLIDATHWSAANWLYPRAGSLALHSRQNEDSAVIESVGSYFVRALRYETARANADPLRSSWTRIAAPSGKIGYAAPDTLLSLSARQLCYVKDLTGRWSIGGFVGGAD